MRTEDVLTYRPIVLTEAQRAAYFSDGFLILPDYVPRTWLERLCAATDELLERSRRVVHSDSIFVLEEGHSAQHPRLHRVSSPQDQHPTFWEFMCDPIMTDLAADMVGPDVKFHHAKLNVKSERGTRGFKWHQDIPAWPHTDYSPVTIGIYLTACDAEQGPLTFLRGSHLGPLHSMYDDSGAFVVHVRDEVAASIPADMVATATGGAGTTVLLNCRTIHGSVENRSDRARPLLLPVYSSAEDVGNRSSRKHDLKRVPGGLTRQGPLMALSGRSHLDRSDRFVWGHSLTQKRHSARGRAAASGASVACEASAPQVAKTETQ